MTRGAGMKMKQGRSCVLSQWGTLPLTIFLPASLALILYFLVHPGKGQEACPFSFQFNCDNGKCITKRFECNERNDCGDGSDERNCFSSKQCARDQFRCKRSGKCIPGQYRCDKKQDCLDGSDEKECSCSWSNIMFNCTSDPYYCIQNIFECDGHKDCPDGSDEKNCRDRCSDNAFSCDKDKGTCVLENRYCEKKQDCPSVLDKKECERSNCSDSQFACRTGECIQGHLKCNKVLNCRDWSDEENCDNCAETEFACTVGGCLTRDKLCNGFPDCADKSDEINCKDGAPNQWLGKSRQRQHQHRSSTLKFADGNVVVYYEKFKSAITWFHHDLSEAWQYVKEMFGLFGDDPRLYVILRYETLNDYTYPKEKDSVCESTLYNNDTYNGRNVILCYTSSAWSTPGTFSRFQLLFTSIGDLIVKELQNNHPTLFSDVLKYLSYLIFYDIFINLRGNTQEIQNWYNKVIQNQTETTDPIDLFHHSIFPHFYAENGLAPVLSNFNILLKIYRPNFSTGALIMHFMSGAAGTDLLSEYSYEFNQSYSSNDEFDIALNSFTTGLTSATSNFPYITYKKPAPDDSNDIVPPRNWHKRWRGQDEHLTFVYYSQRVAFYFKNFQLYFHGDAFQKICQVWKFITENENYGLSSTKPFLSIVLSDVQIQIPGDSDWGCLSSNDFELNDADFDSRHVIECGPSAHSKWSHSNSLGYLDDIVAHMARLILKLNGGVGNWPARDVSAWTMESILVYDSYKSLRTTFEVDHATAWQEAQGSKTEDFPVGRSYWFRDWYSHIYDKYGGPKTIRNFLSLVQEYWPSGNENHVRQMNTGEFILFWGASVNISLLLTYKQDIWRNSGTNIDSQICQAIQDHPNVSYSYLWKDCNSDGNSFYYNRETGNPSISFLPLLPQKSASTGSQDYRPLVFIIIPVAWVTGVIILITGITIAIACVVYHKKVRSLLEKTRELTDDEIDIFFKGNQNADESSPGYGFIESQPFNNDYEIPSDQLQILAGTKLGSGAFGLVLSGTLKGSDDPGSKTAVDIPVAVKTVKPHVDVSIFLALLTEMKVMCFVGKNPHIVALFGAQTTKIRTRQMYIALEFCANGDLLNFLKKNRTDFKDLIGNVSTKKAGARNPEAVTTTVLPGMEMTTISVSEQLSVSFDVTDANQSALISSLDLLKWSRQIASGMEFLGSKNVIHGDLAARNVLLTAEKTAKISDFGLSRQLYNYSTYVKKSKTPLPWNYMAIESLRDMEFSVQSDVWAFGVTLFEIFSLGTIPYAGRNWTIEFVDDLVAGLRLNAPKFGNDDVFNLMMDCMKLEPSERIQFPEMGHRLMDIQRKLEIEVNPGTLSSYVIT